LATYPERRERGSPPLRLPSRLLQAAICLLPLLAYALLAWRSRAVVDDAFINFRIVENILAGAGPVYNVGERVESGTSPAWLAILTLLAMVLRPFGVPLPWISVVVGIGAAVAGLALAELAALRVWQRVRAADPRWPGIALPAGVWIVLGVPPFWEFAASGLETGLAFFWIGLCAWALVTAGGRSRPAWRAVAIGLGPLVRPELAVMSAPFLVALLWQAPRRARTWIVLLGAAAGVPLAAQVFRMGYYGSLVPNTALAKEAFDPFWARGLEYLLDFAEPYWLLVPLAPVVVMAARHCTRSAPGGVRSAAAATIAAGSLHALYIVRLGGDFMHARMLLPSLFALLLPAALWPAGARRRSSAFSTVAQPMLLLLLPLWCWYSATTLRVPYRGQIGPAGIADESNFYKQQSGHPNPVVLDDFRGYGAVEIGEELRALAATGGRFLVFDKERWPLTGGPVAAVVTDGIMIGVAGYSAGPTVHIADTVGLTDPIASRLRLEERGRPGHEKVRLRDWLVGRFIGEDALPAAVEEYAQAGAAWRTLRCGALPELLEAVTAPLTPSRFVRNLLEAPRLSRIRIPTQPFAAERAICGRASAESSGDGDRPSAAGTSAAGVYRPKRRVL
jgi:arabinofuranosyltransferase